MIRVQIVASRKKLFIFQQGQHFLGCDEISVAQLMFQSSPEDANIVSGTSVNLGKYATIFQAEVFAIELCARELSNKSLVNKNISIVSDSQAALKALSSSKINSKLVWSCIGSLECLGVDNRVTVGAWTPGGGG